MRHSRVHAGGGVKSITFKDMQHSTSNSSMFSGIPLIFLRLSHPDKKSFLKKRHSLVHEGRSVRSKPL